MADMSDFEALEAGSRRRHDRVVESMTGDAKQYKRPKDSVISQVSLPRAQKERFTRIAREHGQSLSAFFRLAADEYIRQHGWE